MKHSEAKVLCEPGFKAELTKLCETLVNVGSLILFLRIELMGCNVCIVSFYAIPSTDWKFG